MRCQDCFVIPSTGLLAMTLTYGATFAQNISEPCSWPEPIKLAGTDKVTFTTAWAPAFNFFCQLGTARLSNFRLFLNTAEPLTLAVVLILVGPLLFKVAVLVALAPGVKVPKFKSPLTPNTTESVGGGLLPDAPEPGGAMLTDRPNDCC